MMRRISTIVACTALVFFLSAAAQAWGWGEIRLNQRLAGSCVNPDSFSADCLAQHKGAPGASSSRSLFLYGNFGPPSAQCAGADYETPVVGGSAVATYADLSQMNVVFTSGFVCGKLDGTSKTVAQGIVAGGSGRFEGASGTVSIEADGVAFSPTFPRQASVTGTVTGAIILGN
jgi:hypothetical protein